MRTVIGLALFLTATSSTGQVKPSVKVLFVGNSYIYVENVPQMVSMISDSLKTKIIARKSVVGGAKLSEHWHGRRGLQTRELIEKGAFDIVVLQDFSMNTITEPDSTLHYVRLFSRLIASKKAKIYLFITWAREKVPQFQEQINKIYMQAASENKASVIPVGPAWAAALKARPTVGLFSADGSHASELGAFLEACVMAATIVNEVPRSLRSNYTINDQDGESISLMYVDPLDVEFCLRVTDGILREWRPHIPAKQ